MTVSVFNCMVNQMDLIKIKAKTHEEKKRLFVISKVISKLQNPNLICDRYGIILFANDAYKAQSDQYHELCRFWAIFPASTSMPDYFQEAVEQGVDKHSEILTHDNMSYLIRVVPISGILIDEVIYMINFEDITSKINLNLQLKQDKFLLQKSFLDSIFAFSDLVASRDAYTASHQKRVAALAVNIALKANISDLQLLNTIYYGALIHDIGKIAIPMEYLVTPRQLSQHEFEIIQTHVAVGHKIIKNMDFPWDIKSVVYQHHERLDGSGYPNALKGDEITLPARIVAIADVYEAMSTDRPYRQSIDHETILAYLKENRAVLFDAWLIDCLFQCIAEMKDVFEMSPAFRPFECLHRQ